MLLRLTWHLHAGAVPRQGYKGLIRKSDSHVKPGWDPGDRGRGTAGRA